MALNLNQTLQNKYPNLEMSVLKYSDAMRDNDSKRIDSEFFKRDILAIEHNISKIGYKYFSEFIEILTDYTANGSFASLNANVILYDNENFAKWIRIKDLEANNFENCRYVDEKGYLFLKKSSLFGGELLISKTGEYLGKAFIVPKINTRMTLADNIFLIKLKDISNEFMYVYINSKIGQNFISKLSQGAAQPTIIKDSLRKIKIPLFPLEFQQQIEQMVRESHECLEQSKDLYREAEVLLYQELGLNPQNPLATITPVSQSLNFSVRTLKESLHATGRLDSEYYQIKYDKILRLIKNQRFAKLSDLVDMQKSIEPGSEAYQENGIPFIRVSNFNKFGISDTDIFLDFAEFSQTIKPKKETILLSKDGSIGTAYCVKDDGDFITSSALLHLNIKNEKSKEILPEYLTLILNSVLVKLQAERDSGGSIIAHWRINEIEEILIPILDISIQEKIENLIKQSFALRVRANELLQSAKTKVETAIEQV